MMHKTTFGVADTSKDFPPLRPEQPAWMRAVFAFIGVFLFLALIATVAFLLAVAWVLLTSHA